MSNNIKTGEKHPTGSNNEAIIPFFRKVWKQGGNLVISIPKAHIRAYDLEGKFVKVTLEVISDES